MKTRSKTLIVFFSELSDSINKMIVKYNNIILMGDINIDSVDKKSPGFKNLMDFKDTFGLSNLIKQKTCFFKDHESSIDVILTNQPKSSKTLFLLSLA